MYKIKNLIKGSSLAMVVAGLVIAGVVSAAVLAVYVTMIGKGTVEQSVVFGNGDLSKEYTIGNSPAIAGNTYTQDYNLKNKSETTAPIKFVTQYAITNVHGWQGSEEGVETSYWSTVKLKNKDTNLWTVISNNTEATLTYELVSPAFNYKLEAKGLTPGTDYSLIYYADRQDRFANWGGDNPGALIATAIADDAGNISVEDSINLNMNLPASADWNGTADANYCSNANGFDSYDLCRGAKIWLVPTTEYNSGTKKVSWANPGSYLYETDLITYDDSDTDGEALYLGKGMLNFFVKNVLAINLTPGEYQVKTEVVPVVVE